MKALNIAKYGRFPQLIDLPLPKLDKDHILIKMKYAPINPSDINFFQGFYGIRK
jgi:NADPH:quinone reductase-like Zn-dependent oxidoreductase